MCSVCARAPPPLPHPRGLCHPSLNAIMSWLVVRGCVCGKTWCNQNSPTYTEAARLGTGERQFDATPLGQEDERLGSALSLQSAMSLHSVAQQPQVQVIHAPQQPQVQSIHVGGEGAPSGQLKPCFTMTPAQAGALLALAAGPAGDFGCELSQRGCCFSAVPPSSVSVGLGVAATDGV